MKKLLQYLALSTIAANGLLGGQTIANPANAVTPATASTTVQGNAATNATSATSKPAANSGLPGNPFLQHCTTITISCRPGGQPMIKFAGTKFIKRGTLSSFLNNSLFINATANQGLIANTVAAFFAQLYRPTFKVPSCDQMSMPSIATGHGSHWHISHVDCSKAAVIIKNFGIQIKPQQSSARTKIK